MAKMENIESLLCPICQNEIRHDLLEKLKLNVNDLSVIEDLVNQNLLMQFLELGKLASKYFKPETITTELQVKDSLKTLSEKATAFMDKQRELAGSLVQASEDKKKEMTEKAIKEHRELVEDFQKEIKNLQEQHNKVEQERKHEIEKMNGALQQIQQKIMGVGIGQVRELSVIRNLKSACPEDDLTDEKAKKHGADIVATVMVKGHDVGKIVVSVKEHDSWNGDFIDQIKKNLREEQTDWGILVSKVFPSSALNEKLYVEGNGILVVKTEYAAAAYLGLRLAVIHKNRAETLLKGQQERANLQEHIVRVLRDWVHGDKLREILARIDDARNATMETEDLMQKLQTYSERTIKSARDWQSKIRGYL
ncbi:MAG: DUF2130 domain-containing protein, partial [Nitrososphaerales archaeon]